MDTVTPIYFVDHALEESGVSGASHEENSAALPEMTTMMMQLKTRILQVHSGKANGQFSIHSL
jgi:hypothetical protein